MRWARRGAPASPQARGATARGSARSTPTAPAPPPGPPHGDSSTYEALVHLAQPFSMRYPLIDGQGNFGSRDGDAPAAYRYTEARLSRFSELVLAEIGGGTVDFGKNYDGKFTEPALLPARLPFGLLNGSFGIPVGFSTRIPSHNLREVAKAAIELIKSPKAKLDDVLEH